MSQGELERMTRRYTSEIIEFIGPEKDVPAPDVNTNEQTMAWIMDTYSMHMRQTVTSVVTGKPLNIGGSRGRKEATGARHDGDVRREPALSEAARRRLPGDHSGLWQRRLECRALLADNGYKVIGIAEYDGGLYNPNGIDMNQLLEYKERNGTTLGFRNAEAMPSEEVMLTECDILIPAATENVITSRNADRSRQDIC
jgi:glutamate dehydrogenase (NAD(P)+)